MSILVPEAEIPSEDGDSSKWCNIFIWKTPSWCILLGFVDSLLFSLFRRGMLELEMYNSVEYPYFQGRKINFN